MKCNFTTMVQFTTRRIGALNSTNFRMYLEKDGKPASFFHDLPLRPEGVNDGNLFNMVVEIPRFYNAKAEIATKDSLNPIKYDIKNDKLRFVKNRFPYKGYIWNYGALPQTWEDPNHADPNTGYKGDNDPLDVCEISTSGSSVGEIKQVKLLGILAMIDDGEMDWKLIAIDIKDPKAKEVNDIQDVEAHFPGLLKSTVDWFTYYKVPDGKGKNKFGFDSRFLGVAKALEIVKETNGFWKSLILDKSDRGEIKIRNSTLKDTPGFTNDTSDIPKQDIKPDEPIPGSVDDWYFIPPESKL